MDKWIPLTIVALVLSSIRVFAIIVSSIGMLYSGTLNGLLGKVVYYTNAALHIVILLCLALFLNVAKENIWRSIAFIIQALTSVTFIVMGALVITDTKIWGAVSAVNMLVIIFFTVQAFLIKNPHLKGAFRGYSLVLLLMMLINIAIPYVAFTLALPIKYVQFTSLIYVIPAIFEIILVYLFYQYFSKPGIEELDKIRLYS